MSNGKFYGVTLQEDIVLVDTVFSPQITFLKVEKPILLPGICTCSYSLVESCGDLFLYCEVFADEEPNRCR